jgi:ribosomal protein S21
MVIPRVSATLLYEVSQTSQRAVEINKSLAEQHRRENYEEQSKLLAIQEATRLLRNYNYQKDTEFLRNYEFYESIKEQRLLARNTVRGIFVDRYI